MANEESSDAPSGNTDGQTLAQNPRSNFPEERVVGTERQTSSNQKVNHSEGPTGKVHWINHATFYLSVILAILTGGTVIVYYLQLKQMIKVTQATQDAAYDACMSAKIARRTLLEYQSGESLSHSVASATLSQAAAATRDESAILNIVGITPPDAIKAHMNSPLALSLTNIGRSAARRADMRFTLQILGQDESPRFNDRTVRSDRWSGGVFAPGSFTDLGITMIDDHNKIINSLSDQQKTDLASGKLWMATFGRIEYTDVFGTSHWQTFWQFVDNTPFDLEHPIERHKSCASYNNMDQNQILSPAAVAEASQHFEPIQEIDCKTPQR